jgi:hypothetical protein
MPNLALFLTAGYLATLPTWMDHTKHADHRFLSAVAMVESGNNARAIGDGGYALGKFQMWPAAWKDAQTWAKKHGRFVWTRSAWQNERAQEEMAYCYFKVCQERLAAAGIENPSPTQIYLCYTMGFKAFKDIDFDVAKAPARKLNAAVRVTAIFSK